MKNNHGTLFVVATPIGNLGDMTTRAIETLENVQRIYAEDTRNSLKLMRYFGINNDLLALHDHNEVQKIEEIQKFLEAGNDAALISDAGTPLISDPGYKLVRELGKADIKIVPIPGASAVITALSIAGIPTDRFTFEGFLPAKSTARKQVLAGNALEPRTQVYYESNHRVQACVEDIVEVLGANRQITLARELTKKFEQVYRGPVGYLGEWLDEDTKRLKGEFVLVLQGADKQDDHSASELDHRKMLKVLIDELPVKQAAKIASQLSSMTKNEAYQLALSLK
ncbi:MAG: rRNA small subunit methyltransferase I [uncultured Thiotrichaceae bacterium]|uniref:Ribosomal RNA small subunit methyltransferase I n=1 Tax=uncultured Thiotrichaceae bacterium TaxID=298394 RepID=A0A6S6SL94_9GAMM|nr:MAG: rRNA small subunit methyltransferase I [uncultured Thiotrichaceae bacterium]